MTRRRADYGSLGPIRVANPDCSDDEDEVQAAILRRPIASPIYGNFVRDADGNRLTLREVNPNPENDNGENAPPGEYPTDGATGENSANGEQDDESDSSADSGEDDEDENDENADTPPSTTERIVGWARFIFRSSNAPAPVQNPPAPVVGSRVTFIPHEAVQPLYPIYDDEDED